MDNVTKSITGKQIRLPNERWVHIVEGHPEMAGHLYDVLLAVAMPDAVVMGAANELLAAVFSREDKLLVVVYKELDNDGFILTAFFTKKIDKIFNKTIIWQK